MKLFHSKQTWKGTFTYNGDFEDADLIEVDFTMELMCRGSQLCKISTDSESAHLFDEPAQVTGLFDDEKISFVKKHPCLYFNDEDGNVVADPDTKHTDNIYIYIIWDSDQDKTGGSGTLEMEVYQALGNEEGISC